MVPFGEGLGSGLGFDAPFSLRDDNSDRKNKMLTDDSDKQDRGPELPSTITSSLLQGVRELDHGAWERMVNLYYPMLYGWCRRSGLQPDDAADVCQNVLRSVATSLHNFRREQTGDTFRGWLRRITQRRIIEFRQRLGRRPEAIGGSNAQNRLAELVDEYACSSESGTEVEFLHGLLELVRNEFENQTWMAFWKTTVDGESAADAAADLNMTRNAVYLAKSRVLRRLREEFTDPFDAEVTDPKEP